MADAGEQASSGSGRPPSIHRGRDGEDSASPSCPCGLHAATPENPSGLSAIPPPSAIGAELHVENSVLGRRQFILGKNGETYRIVRTLTDCLMGKVRYEQLIVRRRCRSVCCSLGYDTDEVRSRCLPGKTGGSL